MPEKPSRAAEYSKEQVQLVKDTCLYVATILRDYMEQTVVVGGLVPSILIDQKNLPDGADSHVGTTDLGTWGLPWRSSIKKGIKS